MISPVTHRSYHSKFLRILLLAHVLIMCHFGFSQTFQIDSLKQIIETLPNDTVKANALNQLAWKYYELRNKNALESAEQAFQLSETLNFIRGKGAALQTIGLHYTNVPGGGEKALDYFSRSREIFSKIQNQSGIAATYINEGIVHLGNSDYENSLKAFQQSIEINKPINNNEGIANALLNMAVVYDYMSDYPKALSLLFESLKLYEGEDAKWGTAETYNMISIIYSKQNDIHKSIDFNHKALEIYAALDNQYNVASSYNNLGINYKKLEDYDKAIECYDKAGQIFNEIGEIWGQTSIWHNLGELFRLKLDYSKALEYYDKSLEEGKKIGWKRVIMSNLEGKAKLFNITGKPNEALAMATEGLEIAKETKSVQQQLSFHELLYQSSKLLKRHSDALLYLERFLENKDSLYNLEKTKLIKELQTKYDTEKNEQEIALLNKDNALKTSEIYRKSMTQNILVTAIAAFSLIGFLTFRNYRMKQYNKSLLLNEQLKLKKFEAEKLSELNEVKSRFFSNIAHEFRTPLTLILGPLENLLEKGEPHSTSSQMLMLAKRNANKLLNLINQLLELSKLESGMATTTLENDDIVNFVKTHTFAFLSLAEQKDIQLTFESEIQSGKMDFDKDKLEKVMNNLLSNAFKFTPASGSIAVKVWEQEGEHLQNLLWISVTDTGVGISPEQLAFVFERFYQGKNESNIEGSGIGLALAKELVELHKGAFRVESEPGKGSCFSFYLPISNRTSNNQEDIVIENSKETIVETTAPLQDIYEINSTIDLKKELAEDAHAEMVLVIEDNDDVRNFIMHSLQPHYKVLEAINGAEGIKVAMEHIPDLIISDVMMPELDGYETCRRLKNEEKTSHIPIILLTAKAGLESKLEGLHTGADDYLGKPFNARELLARMQNLITIRKNLRKKFLQHAVSEEKIAEIAPIEDAFLKKLRETIELHLDEEAYSIEELSREIGMSRAQVHRKLKALTNQSASRFIRIIRLNHAKILLDEGNLNVSEVAYKVGFNSPTYFSTCFAEYFGFAPSDIKKSI